MTRGVGRWFHVVYFLYFSDNKELTASSVLLLHPLLYCLLFHTRSMCTRWARALMDLNVMYSCFDAYSCWVNSHRYNVESHKHAMSVLFLQTEGVHYGRIQECFLGWWVVFAGVSKQAVSINPGQHQPHQTSGSIGSSTGFQISEPSSSFHGSTSIILLQESIVVC